MKLIGFLTSFALLFSLALIPSVHAADIRLGEAISINANDLVSSNLYVSGAQVTIPGSSAKDAIVAGGRVIINGPVSGDILAAGGTVDILERVSGDVRAIGGQITISGLIGGDLIVAGGVVHLLPGASVSGDVVIVGGQATLDGTISGMARLYGGTVLINGLMGGDVLIRAGDSVAFGDRAVIGSSVAYTAPQEAVISEKATLGSHVTFTELAIPARSLGPSGVGAIFAAVAGVIIVAKLLTAVVTSVALVLVFPRFSRRVISDAFENFWKAAGIGFIVFAATPVALFVLAITIVGMAAAFMLAMVFVFLLFLSALYANVMAGALLAQWITKGKALPASWLWTILGVVVLFALSLIPFVGWLVAFVFLLASLGTIGQAIYRRVFDAAPEDE